MPLQRKKIIISLFLFALMALFLATGYFFVFKKDKILEALSVQKFSLQNLSSASVSQSQFGIRVVKAVKLNENKNETEDVFAKVQAKDNVWATVDNNQYIRVAFAKPLTKENDITIFAKINGPDQEASGNKIEVYIEDGTKIAEFPEIKHARSYKILLTSLNPPAGGATDTFYLKATGSVAIDYIVDPTEGGIAFTGGIKLDAGIRVGWVCGDSLVDARDSKTYDTVLIGTQCWMAENLNYGTRINSSSDQGADCPSIEATEKYCYNDSEANCTTYGGLYKWSQLMCGAASCNGTGESQPSCSSPVQGICPTGWHIPSHYEFVALERAVCTSESCATDFPYDTSTLGRQGTNEGTKLKIGGSSGFNALLAGFSNTDGSFQDLSVAGVFSSSTLPESWPENGEGWYRYLFATESEKIYRGYVPHAEKGFSIRCIKD